MTTISKTKLNLLKINDAPQEFPDTYTLHSVLSTGNKLRSAHNPTLLFRKRESL